MFWADFGSRQNGRFGEAVRGLSAFFGPGSFIAVLRGHRAEATKGASDCRGEE